MNEPIQTAADVACPCLSQGDHGTSAALDQCLAGRSLAMVYSPCQVFEGIYAPMEGLCRGTVFMELEKPFYGARRLK
jgi:hypothetical protein